MKHVYVEGFPSIENGVDAEMIRGMLPRPLADGSAVLRWNPHHPQHCRRQRQRASRPGQEAGLPVDEGLACSGYSGGNGGQGAGGSLQKTHGKAFPKGRLNEGVGGLHPGADIGLETEELDAAFQAKFMRQASQVVFFGAGAGDDQAGRLRQVDHGAEKSGVVLYRFQAAGGEPEKLVIEAEPAPDGVADSCIGTPQLDIDSVGEHEELFFAYHARGEVRFGCGVADGGDFVGKPIAEAIAELAAESAGGRAVNRVDQNADGRGQARPACEPGGVREVGMDDFGAFAAQPVVKANPSARVGQALAHVQAQERDSDSGQFGGRTGAGARKRKHADAPAAEMQPMGEKDHLPLGAGDAVKSGNHEGYVTHEPDSRMVESIRSS